MLYERWREIAGEHPHELALCEVGTGRRFTFGELAAAAEAAAAPVGPVVFAECGSADFVLSLLGAWRWGRTFVPLERGQARPELYQTPGVGVAHLKTTSATTGRARMIAFTEEQLAADATNIVETMGLRREWPNLGLISLAHSYGFSNLALPLLLEGIPLILADGALPERVRRVAADFGDLTLAAVPVLWRTWHETWAIPAQVRLAISAGAPLPLWLERAVFERSGLKIHNFYGSSECGGIAYDVTTTPRVREGCVGSALRNVKVRIGEDGCVEVESRAVGAGYWPDPEARLEKGVYRTSDLGVFEGSELVIQGRAGEQINVAGRKVSPEVIERSLMGHEAVAECVVFGAPEEETHRGEHVVAWVCLREGGCTTLDDLRKYLSGILPLWQVPREWRLLADLPVNARGKLSRAECRRLRASLGAGDGTILTGTEAAPE